VRVQNCPGKTHGKRRVFQGGDEAAVHEEVAANAFAADLLTRRASAARLRMLALTSSAVEATAAEVGVAPGIVVGRHQHDGLVPLATGLNALKLRYEWVVSGDCGQDHD
jgi:HTH-type transcriptional regulator/antitoxin HigA